jgi:DNA-binding PadR family transcriptional regulator
MDKTLFLLGLIRNSEMYGYQINELIDSHFDLIVSITKPTAYRLLSKMAADDWISAREERIGGRPPRKIYSITPQGEAAFQEILRLGLSDFSSTRRSGIVSLAFLSHVPADELLPLLLERKEKVQALLDKLALSRQHQEAYRLVFEHQQRHYETELSWIEERIDSVRKGSS